MKTVLALAAILALALTGCGYYAAATGADTTALKGTSASDFTLRTLSGDEVKLSDQKGKVVLVDTWATWCPPCRASLPHIQQISADKELAEKGLVVWAVNDAEEKPTVEAFLKENHFTFTVPMDAKANVLKQYQVEGIPTTIIVGRDGIIKDVFVGFGTDSAKLIDAAVNKALAEPAPK